MKKKWISVILTLALTIGTCSIAAAADRGTATRNSLKSYGAIEYHKGDDKVVLNADDLYMLADQIDQIKFDVIDQMEAMNTYFTAGDGISLNTDRYINVTHARPSRADFVDPLTVNFDTMLEGIAASQSVSSDVTAYGYSPGTKLYVTANGSLTTNASADGATQINVSAATADNLSAGTVAWVNGQLILGTGGDNESYFNLGYDEGKAEGGSSGTDTDVLNRAECIRLSGSDGKGKSYTVQEDMTDVILILTSTSSRSPVFSSSGQQPVYRKVVGLKNRLDQTDTTYTYCNIYIVSTLKKGTVLTKVEGGDYLVRFDGVSPKGGNAQYKKLSSSYCVGEDLKDVLLIRQSTNGASNPDFEPAPGAPIVQFKKLFSKTYKNLIYKNWTVFYVPELKASTVMKNSNEYDYIIY